MMSMLNCLNKILEKILLLEILKEVVRLLVLPINLNQFYKLREVTFFFYIYIIFIKLYKNKIFFKKNKGNLEGIYPRILVLRRVKELIDKKKYKLAFDMCKVNKLDLNLIFDINA